VTKITKSNKQQPKTSLTVETHIKNRRRRRKQRLLSEAEGRISPMCNPSRIR